MTTTETKSLLRAKKDLQNQIIEIVNQFHEDYPGFEVYTITPHSDKIVKADTGDVQVVCTEVSCSIKLA